MFWLTEDETSNLFGTGTWAPRENLGDLLFSIPGSAWYRQIRNGENTVADAIMDRICDSSYEVEFEDPFKDVSIREIFGMDPQEAK